MIKISAVILTKNEEKNIERCLKSIDFCDEIIVIDDFSDDETVELTRKFEANVYQRKLNNDFSAQRNFGLEKAKGEWILFIDVDEEVGEELKKEILEKVEIGNAKAEIAVYYIKRRDYWWGRELRFGEVKKTRTSGLIRLVKKNSGKWTYRVHEVFKASGYFGHLKSFINHYPHPTLKDFIEEINFYSTVRARELLSQGKKTNILEIIFYPSGKFILNYFVYLGFLDGAAGFVYAFMMSFHSFLVRAKLFQYMQIDAKQPEIQSFYKSQS